MKVACIEPKTATYLSLLVHYYNKKPQCSALGFYELLIT